MSGGADEAMDWLHQFGGVHDNQPRWKCTTSRRFTASAAERVEVKTISLNHLLQTNAGTETMDRKQGLVPTGTPEDGEQFDVIFCFDVLERTIQPDTLTEPVSLISKPDGKLYIQVFNPYAAPRVNQTCLTAEDHCVYPFRTLIYTLYKNGFNNEGAEMSGKTRCICGKLDTLLSPKPSEVVPREYWAETTYRFQRNYYWMWVTRYLENYITQVQVRPEILDISRNQLSQNYIHRHFIRDVCGACLLFVQEVSSLQPTLAEDWHITMSRIFTAFKYDYALFDLLQRGNLTGIGIFPHIERFYFNEKMIYMTDADYFHKYFSEQEANQLCHIIVEAGKVVCGHLSSLL